MELTGDVYIWNHYSFIIYYLILVSQLPIWTKHLDLSIISISIVPVERQYALFDFI